MSLEAACGHKPKHFFLTGAACSVEATPRCESYHLGHPPLAPSCFLEVFLPCCQRLLETTQSSTVILGQLTSYLHLEAEWHLVAASSPQTHVLHHVHTTSCVAADVKHRKTCTTSLLVTTTFLWPQCFCYHWISRHG